ncbi:mechanosensitive ion channel domain-containing protein [Microcoleus sp. EPA2]|uniref:mechanosensitive ion channel family protein n=1 Tax=Microcoleus sp. EPA2 TaxID=2841654 RepID=UPI00312BC51F
MWMLQLPFKLPTKLIILFLLGWFLFTAPRGFAQGVGGPRSSVVVDGIPLFHLQPVERFTAFERTQFANNLLSDALSNEKVITFDVRNDSDTSATSISLNKNYLLTVTANDVLPNFSVFQQAKQWQNILEVAVAKAKKERSREYILQRSIWILISIATIIILRFLSLIVSKLFKWEMGILSKVFFGCAWVAIAIASSEWFPVLRSIRYQIVSPFSQPQWVIFLGALGGSFVFSHYAPALLRFAIKKLDIQSAENIYLAIIQPSDRLVQFSVLSISITWSLTLLETLVPFVYNLLKPIASLILVGCLYWLSTQLSSRYLRTYGFKLGAKFSPSSDDAILVFETVFNIFIFMVALVTFARSVNFDLIGLVASLGLVGLAVAFAAQKILEQLIATLVLYLDRPFVTGDYIRLPAGELGKVESIGLRSTKIRSLGTGTIIVMPNSILVNVEIENVTLAKKIMVLLYMDFASVLGEREYALVQQAIMEKTAFLSGIDGNSTNIALADGSGTRLRVSFAILGSQDNAMEVRKRLLELASAEIAKSLSVHGIVFTMENPTIYVQSPVTI